MKCFLDLDGVLVNIVEGIKNTLGYDEVPEMPGEYDFNVIFGTPMNDFFNKVDAYWWHELKPTHDADDIVGTVLRYFDPQDVCILTAMPSQASPKARADCVHGKLLWLHDHWPMFDVLIGRDKTFPASRRRILIDDADHNIDAFRKADGHGILYPRMWNSLYYRDGVSHLRDQLESLCQ